MRERSLSDARVIALVRQHFVPVWVNVTEQPVPDLPALASVRREWEQMQHDPVTLWFFRTFQQRTFVLSPDGKRALHPKGWKSSDEPDQFVAMLHSALRSWQRMAKHSHPSRHALPVAFRK
ncbi:MAG: hypothetical protein KEFWMYNX_002015 [Candidatus Fervidibacter sp.]|mgnify:FL=1